MDQVNAPDASTTVDRRVKKADVTVCVAIPTYNRERVLINTLKQVFNQVPPADEVLVIDQTIEHASETRSFLSRSEASGQIRWFRQQPPNLPGARNRALRETSCDVVIFIDDDVELPATFVHNHRRNYADPRVVAVSGRTIQPPGHRYPDAKSEWPRHLDYKYFPLNSTERKEGIASFIGCNHSVRASWITRIGGYDENYIAWAFREDADAAIRIWKSGGLIVFDPDAELTHLAIPGGGCRLKTKKRRIPEWHVSFPASYFACRHLLPSMEFWSQVFCRNIRRYVLRADNLLRPWRLPMAFAFYAFSLSRAVWLACGPVKSPFVDREGYP